MAISNGVTLTNTSGQNNQNMCQNFPSDAACVVSSAPMRLILYQHTRAVCLYSVLEKSGVVRQNADRWRQKCERMSSRGEDSLFPLSQNTHRNAASVLGPNA